MAEVDKNNIWHGTVEEALRELLRTHDDCMCDRAKDLVRHILKSADKTGGEEK